MKEYTIKEYEKEDYELLENMDSKRVIELLEYIERGYLPQNYGYYNGKENDYYNTELHIAMRKAIECLKESEA